MRRSIAVFALSCVVFGASCNGRPGSGSVAEDTPENRRQAAEAYLRVVPPAELMRDATEKMTESLPEPMRARFATAMSELDVRGLNEAMLDSMEKRFTVAELDALTKFYGSKEGRSVMQKFGLYMSDVMPVMQAEIAKAIAKAGRGS